MSTSSRSIPLVWPPLVLVANIFIVVPLTVYLGNLNEFSLTLLELLAISLVPAAVVYAVLLSVNIVLSRTVRTAYAGALSLLAVLCWVQATVVVRNYGPLNGSVVNWNSFGNADWTDGLMWLIGLGVGAAIIWRGKAHVLFKLAVALLIIQVLSNAVDVGTNFGELAGKQREAYNANPENIYEFSKTQNIIHILVDGFQSDVFADLLESPTLGPDYSKSFSGFVYYPETLGVFPYTQFAIPALLTGDVYKNEVTKNKFLDEAMSKKSILGVAREQGYEIDIAAPGAYLYGQYAKIPNDNIYRLDLMGRTHPVIADILMVADISLFRLVPHNLKSAVYNDQQWFFQAMLSVDESFRYDFFQNTFFLSELIKNLSVTREEPVYKYIHVTNTHRPMVASFGCAYAGRTFRDARITLSLQSKCTLDTLATLMAKLKILGIYDSSLIIIHSDHGGWVPNRRQGPPIRLATGAMAPSWLSSLASPLMSIKLPESSGPLSFSDAQVSLLDLPDTISDALAFGAYFGQSSMLSLPTDKDRIRSFYFYPWQTGEWDKTHTWKIQEYVIHGSHYENRWQLGDIFSAP